MANIFKRTAVQAAMAAALAVSGSAMAQASAEGWQFTLEPYVWLPTVSGKLNYGPPPVGGGSARVEVDPNNYFDSLDMAAMLTGTARNGRWVIGTDVIYLHFSGTEGKVQSVDLNPGSGPINVSTSSVSAGASSDLKGTVWTLAGGYAVVQDPKANLEVIGGFRYLGLRAETNWELKTTITGTGPDGRSATFGRQGGVSKREDVWAGIVGLRGRANFGDSDWFARGYVDVGGGGSSTFTWQGLAGVGYAFKWGDLNLDYRYLYYSQNDDKLIDNISFGGLALGANFRF